MCGRYSLALRPSQVRTYLENEDMPVYDLPEDEGDYAPRQSYNFAPGYVGIVYRADVPDWGAGPRSDAQEEANVKKSNECETTTKETPIKDVRYKLQCMKWGLIPFWTKRSPNYRSTIKTINCRDDSLIENQGMWTTMKQKKRCIVIAQGFYEWLKKPNSKDKIPHYIKRKDDKLMCMAGLWDCAQYEGLDEKLYTYTIITTSSNKQLSFLHDRMPVIFDNGSEDIRTWLDPRRHRWSSELQSLLRPYTGELDVYPVSRDVGKVGNNSPTFIVPIDSADNKNNIASFFSNYTGATSRSESMGNTKHEIKKLREESVLKGEYSQGVDGKRETQEGRKTIDHSETEENTPLPVPNTPAIHGLKRERIGDVPDSASPVVKKASTPSYRTGFDKVRPSLLPVKSATKTRCATSNDTKNPLKRTVKDKGNQKITGFFGK